MRDSTIGTIYGLYCACGCDGRVMYIGQTAKPINKRQIAHRYAARYENHNDFRSEKSWWARKHGVENIFAKALETNPADGLDAAEERWIEQLQTRTLGFNKREGGYYGSGQKGISNPGNKLTESMVREIIAALEAPDATSRKIAAEYDVTKTLVLKIDHGELWPEIERPNGLNRLARNRKSTTSIEQVRKARALYQSGSTVQQVAVAVGLSWQTANGIVKGKTWTSVS